MATLASVQLPIEKDIFHGLTFEAWLAQAPESRIEEWVEGEVLEIMPVLDIHDSVSQWLIKVLGTLIEERALGVLRAAPFVLKLLQSARGREPDLMFISNTHADRLHPTYVEGAPDAVFEIVSPESVARDRGQKFVEYETEAIPEYWMVDPDRHSIEPYRLDEQGRYQPIPLRDGRYESAVIPGFYLRPEWLSGEPLPRVLAVLREFGVV